MIAFGVIIYALINYGVRNRVYLQSIKHDRKLDFAGALDIDVDDLDSYPKSLHWDLL